MNRPLQLTPSDVERLLEYMKKMNLGPSDWFFPSSKREKPLRHEDILARKIQPRTKELGLPHVTWKILRKWGSTQMLNARVPVTAMQQRLGHSRPDIVLLYYAQLSDASALQAAQTISAQLSRPKIVPEVAC